MTDNVEETSADTTDATLTALAEAMVPNESGAQDDAEKVADSVLELSAEEKGPNESAEESAAEPAKDSEEDTEPEYINSLAELAEENEWDVEQLLDLGVNIEGREEPIALKDLTKHYVENHEETARLKENNLFAQQQLQSFKDFFVQLHQSNEISLGVMDAMEANLMKMAEDPELIAKKESDKEFYATRLLEIKEHAEQLRNHRAMLMQQYDDSLSAGREALVKQESARLRQLWGKESNNNFVNAVNVIRSLGFNDGEISDMLDSRFYIAAKELHDLREENAALKANKTKRQRAGDKAKQLLKNSKVKVLRPTGGSPEKSGSRKGASESFDHNVAQFRQSKGENVKAFEDAIGSLLTG